RNLVPDRVGVELIAPLQQQLEWPLGVHRGKVQPALVARRQALPGVALLAAVAGGEGKPQTAAAARRMHPPALPPDAIFDTAPAHAVRQREIVAPQAAAASRREAAGSDARRRGLERWRRVPAGYARQRVEVDMPAPRPAKGEHGAQKKR